MSYNKCYSSYLTTAFEPRLFKKAVDSICKICKHIGSKNFDAIAFRGMSGSLIAPSIALKLNKKMIMVRKEDDHSHSSYRVEGYKLANRIVIVDDLIASGETTRKLVQTLIDSRENCSNLTKLKVVAIILYHDSNQYGDGMESYYAGDLEDYLLGIAVYSFKFELYTSEKVIKWYYNRFVREALNVNGMNEQLDSIRLDLRGNLKVV